MEDAAIGVLFEFEQSLLEDKNCVRIHRKSSAPAQYVVFSAWAEKITRSVTRTSGTLRYLRNEDGATPYLLFSDSIFREIVLDVMDEGGHILELYADRKLIKKATPSRMEEFDDIIFASNVSIIALHLSRSSPSTIQIACAVLNSSLRTFNTCTFLDHTLTFQNLKVLFISNSAKEVVLHPLRTKGSPINDGGLGNILDEEECARFSDVCSRHSIRISDYKGSIRAWHADYAKVSIDRIIRRSETVSKWSRENPIEVSLCGGLIDHLALLQEECNFGQYRITPVVLGSFMKLDASSIDALHIFPQQQSACDTSLYDLLKRHCNTSMGMRLLRFYLTQPLTKVDTITSRQNMVSLFLEDAILREGIKSEVLSSLPDMDRFMKKMQRQKTSLKEIFDLNSFLTGMFRLATLLENYAGEQQEMLQCDWHIPLKAMCVHFEKLSKLIENVIEVDEDRGISARIRPQFDAALAELEEARQSTYEQINIEYQKVLTKYNWTERFAKLEPYAPTGGFTFRVSRKDDKEARQNKKFNVLQTSKDGVRFVNSELSALSSEYRNISSQYSQRQRQLEEKLLETVRSYRPVLDDAVDLVAQMDVFISWGTLIARSRNGFCLPSFNSHRTRLTQLRHPLIQDQGDAVANGIDFEHFEASDTTFAEVNYGSEAAEMYIITGPNMGGKSTFMRAVALVHILAQIGCFVPCECAEIVIRDSILCRVGAGDIMAHGVSTFMREMQETAHIINCATPDSLVIIDELGRGTSTYDGFGIAWAVAEHIATEIHSFTLLATHFHEMTALPDMLKNSRLVRNLHVTAICETGSLCFPYKLLPGPCFKSFGLHVAEMARMPEEALKVAREKSLELEGKNTGFNAKDSQSSYVHSNMCNIPLEKLTSYAEEYTRNPNKEMLRARILADGEMCPEVLALLPQGAA